MLEKMKARLGFGKKLSIAEILKMNSPGGAVPEELPGVLAKLSQWLIATVSHDYARPSDREHSTTPLVSVHPETSEYISTPYLDGLIDTASARNLSLEEVLALEGPVLSTAQTSDCLKPDEVVECMKSGSLPYLRQEHLATCAWCITLVASARPIREEFEAVVERARQAASHASFSAM